MLLHNDLPADRKLNEELDDVEYLRNQLIEELGLERFFEGPKKKGPEHESNFTEEVL